MAKFVSQIFAEIRGSVAGMTFSRNKNAAYTRNKTVGINRNTEAQQRVRSFFATASANWRNLTASQKQSFQDMVASYPYVNNLGQTVTGTAKQLHDRLNGALNQSGLGMILNAVPPVAMVSVFNALVETHKNTNTIVLAEWETGDGQSVPDNWVCNVYATVLTQGVSKAYKRPDFRLIGQFPETTDPNGEELQAMYEAVFGTSWRTGVVGKNSIGFGFLMVNKLTGQMNSSMYVTTAGISL